MSYSVIVRHVVTLCLIGAVGATPLLAINLPAGFQETTVISGLGQPMDLTWDPDGDLWYSLLDGRIWVHRQGTSTLIGTVTTQTGGESGLHAFTLDPDFATNHRLWAYFTVPDGTVTRLSHFTIVNDQLTAETVVLDMPNASQAYNGGCLDFRSDGTIFLANGFDGDRDGTRDPFTFKGKLLRIDTNGDAPADNPFADGVLAEPRVWSMGLRNPFRCGFEPGTDRYFMGDVGATDWEEINIAVAGGDFGWDAIDGPVPAGNPDFVYPFHVYPHGTVPPTHVSAVIGGDFVESGEFAPPFEGDYFFGDYNRRKLFRMRLDSAGEIISVDDFATDIFGAVKFRFGDDGALYYVSYNQGAIRKIEFVGPLTSGGSTTGLAVGRGAGSALEFSWNPSCADGDTDYALYAGTLGSFSSAAAVTCTTNGRVDFSMTPSAGDRFYIVVPNDEAFEGSFGTDHLDVPRTPPTTTCFPSNAGACP